MKIIFSISIIFLVHFLTCKKSIDIQTNRENITIQIPCMRSYNISKNHTMRVSTQDGKSYIDILYGLFDRPMFFFYDKKSDSIFVLYFFDIEMHIFAIEKDDNISNADMLPMGRSLKRIIPSVQNFNVRALTRQELDSLANDISSMPEKEYKQMSIPTLDLGVYKLYGFIDGSKDGVLRMLKKGLHVSSEDKDIRVIHSRMNVW